MVSWAVDKITLTTKLCRILAQLCLWLAVILVASCAIQAPAPVTDYGKPSDDPAFPPDLSDYGVIPNTIPETSAVVALLEDAEKKVRAGELGGAAATLERALRIEPRNGLLWSKLATVRYQQEQLDQAEQLARKSNQFAVEDPPLQAHNWRLIAEIRQRHGDSTEAEYAMKRYRELR